LPNSGRGRCQIGFVSGAKVHRSDLPLFPLFLRTAPTDCCFHQDFRVVFYYHPSWTYYFKGRAVCPNISKFRSTFSLAHPLYHTTSTKSTKSPWLVCTSLLKVYHLLTGVLNVARASRFDFLSLLVVRTACDHQFDHILTSGHCALKRPRRSSWALLLPLCTRCNRSIWP
jgi:hypothetical protein